MRPSSEALDVALLSALDHLPPSVGAGDIIALARQRHRARRRIRRIMLGAVFAATAAAAAPAASPLWQLASRVLAGTAPPVKSPERPAAIPALAPPSLRGIAFVPGPFAEVVFRNAQPSGAFRIRVENAPTLRVTRASGDGRFALTPTGVVIENGTSDLAYQISMPEHAARIVVRVGNRVVFMKDNARISAAVGRDSGGSYVIPFSSSISSRRP